jgi:hypothetical protein
VAVKLERPCHAVGNDIAGISPSAPARPMLFKIRAALGVMSGIAVFQRVMENSTGLAMTFCDGACSNLRHVDFDA